MRRHSPSSGCSSWAASASVSCPLTPDGSPRVGAGPRRRRPAPTTRRPPGQRPWRPGRDRRRTSSTLTGAISEPTRAAATMTLSLIPSTVARTSSATTSWSTFGGGRLDAHGGGAGEGERDQGPVQAGGGYDEQHPERDEQQAAPHRHDRRTTEAAQQGRAESGEPEHPGGEPVPRGVGGPGVQRHREEGERDQRDAQVHRSHHCDRAPGGRRATQGGVRRGAVARTSTSIRGRHGDRQDERRRDDDHHHGDPRQEVPRGRVQQQPADGGARPRTRRPRR